MKAWFPLFLFHGTALSLICMHLCVFASPRLCGFGLRFGGGGEGFNAEARRRRGFFIFVVLNESGVEMV